MKACLMLLASFQNDLSRSFNPIFDFTRPQVLVVGQISDTTSLRFAASVAEAPWEELVDPDLSAVDLLLLGRLPAGLAPLLSLELSCRFGLQARHQRPEMRRKHGILHGFSMFFMASGPFPELFDTF